MFLFYEVGIMIYERIKELCKARGITVAKLEQDLELGRSSVRKFDQHDPGVGKMNMIAGYLGVTLNDLIDADFDSDKKLDTLANQMFSDKDMRDIYFMKKGMTEERFALYKKLLSEMFKAENPDQ